jgi:hypothetical protein
MAARTWTCQRKVDGVKCATVNPKRKMICEVCGGKRAPAKKLAHKRCLEVFPYETWVLFFGERCNICGAVPAEGKKLQRDHDHRTGAMRALLCWPCNSKLPYNADIEWMRKALAYLDRTLQPDNKI